MKLFGSSHSGGAHRGVPHKETDGQALSPQPLSGQYGEPAPEQQPAPPEQPAPQQPAPEQPVPQQIYVSEIRSDDPQADAAVGREIPPPPGGGETPPAPSAPPPKKKRTGLFVLGIVGAVLLALIAFVGIHYLIAGHFIWEEPLKPRGGSSTPVPAATHTPAPTATVRPPEQSGAPQDSEETPPPEETGPIDDFDYESNALQIAADAPRKDGVFTFLLAGIDYASSSTDTIMVLTFDTKYHVINGVSIPRDTLVNIGWSTTPKKINAIYPGYKNSGRDGVEGLRNQIKNILGFDVDYYVMVSLDAVEHAVDAVGGVDFDVPEDMVYWDPTQNLRINIMHGMQHLNGEDALKLCRYRITYAGGDLQRITVQHNFLKAMATQVIQKISVSNIAPLVDILINDVETDLTSGNLAWLGRQFLACNADDIHLGTAPNYASGINDISFVGLSVDQWLSLLNEYMNPYVDDITVGNLNILTFNYGGSHIGSTTGVIAGGYDSFYCLSCTVKNDGKVVYHAPGAHWSFASPEPSSAPSGSGGQAAGSGTGEPAEGGAASSGETGTSTAAPEPTPSNVYAPGAATETPSGGALPAASSGSGEPAASSGGALPAASSGGTLPAESSGGGAEAGAGAAGAGGAENPASAGSGGAALPGPADPAQPAAPAPAEAAPAPAAESGGMVLQPALNPSAAALAD